MVVRGWMLNTPVKLFSGAMYCTIQYRRDWGLLFAHVLNSSMQPDTSYENTPFFFTLLI